MNGAFGGSLDYGATAAIEVVSTELADLLVPSDSAPPSASNIPIRGDAASGRLTYQGDLRGLKPLEKGGLGALVDVASSLEELHERGRAHGDLRPANVWTGARGTRVTYPEKPLDASLLLRARLRAGADPRDVSFVAPEVLAGSAATPASDVFSLAALAYFTITGNGPHGRLEPLTPACSSSLERAILEGLEPSPEKRHALRVLKKELVASAPAPVLQARLVTAPESEGTARFEPASDEAVPAARLVPKALPIEPVDPERRQTSAIIVILLAIGGLFVLTGALWLVAVGWNVVGEIGRFGILAALTGAMYACGRALERQGHARSGLALTAIFSQLLWADGAYVLVLTGSSGSPGAWAVVSGAVAAVGYLLASKRRSILLGILGSLGALLAIICTWSALDELGHLALLSTLTAGVAGTGFAADRRGRGALATGLHALWSQLLWIDAWYVLDLVSASDKTGHWAIAAAGIGATGLGLGAVRRSVVSSVLGTIASSVALLLLGDALKTGRPEGVAIWTLVCAVTLGAISCVVGIRAGKAVALPPFVAALLFGLASVTTGLAVSEHDSALETFSITWPYLVAGVAGAAALLARGRAGELASALSMESVFALVATPVFHGLMHESAPDAYRHGAAVAGAILIVLALLWPRAREHSGREVACFLIGLAHVSAEQKAVLTVSGLACVLLGSGLRRRHSGLMSLGAAAAAVALVLVGDASGIQHCQEIGYALVGGAVILAAIAFLGERRGGPELGLGASIAAALFLLASFVCGLTGLLESRDTVFGALWPYATTAIAVVAAIGLGKRGATPHQAVAIGTALTMLTVAPTAEALGHDREQGFLFLASVVGTLVVLAAFKWEAIARSPRLNLIAVVVGLASITIAPNVLALFRLCDQNGDALLTEVLDPTLTPQERLAHRLFYLSYFVGTAGTLVALGLLFARGATAKLPYRILELAGLLTFFGTLTLLSVARHREYLYPGVLFLGGFVALGVGAWQRHMLLVVLPAIVLVPNLWFQYFVKLSDAVPGAVLVMGCGLGIVAGGIYFERRVRPALKGLGEWA